MNLFEKKEFINITKKNILEFYKENFDKKYKRKYTIDYYLDLMFELINDVNNWNSITKLKIYNPIQKFNNNIPKFHWKTVQNLFNKWSDDGIFKIGFDNFIHKKTIDINNIDLFIDTTFINNKYGVENIALNTDNKKKKSTKISLISDNDKFIYSVSYVPINNKKIKYKKRRKNNKKRRKQKYIKKIKLNNKKKVKGFVHDVNTINFSIKNINKKYNFKIELIGDKGYITSNKFYFKRKKIELITPNKKNQKIKKNNKKIIKRKIIENTIACIKKNERILTRKDHKIKNYMSWIYISCLLHNIKINKSIN
jgi:hypothetical protein